MYEHNVSCEKEIDWAKLETEFKSARSPLWLQSKWMSLKKMVIKILPPTKASSFALQGISSLLNILISVTFHHKMKVFLPKCRISWNIYIIESPLPPIIAKPNASYVILFSSAVSMLRNLYTSDIMKDWEQPRKLFKILSDQCNKTKLLKAITNATCSSRNPAREQHQTSSHTG